MAGYTLPPPKPTAMGWGLLVLYLGVPVFGGFMALDLVFYAIARFGFGQCYGLGCLLG